MDDYKVILGNNIAYMRKKKRITQKDLSGKLNVDNRSVSAYEKERRVPAIITLLEMCEILAAL